MKLWKRVTNSLISRILFVILLFLFAIGAVFQVQGYRDQKRLILLETGATLETFEKVLDAQLSSQGRNLSMALEILLQNRELTEAFADRNMSAVEEMILGFFKGRLEKVYGLRQFQFHTPPATTFYRAHQPGRFGDDLSTFRQTVVKTNQTRKPVVGIEVGRHGLGLRVVYPVFHQGEHVGSVEFGGDLALALEAARGTTGTDFAIGVYQEVFQAAKRFEAGDHDVVKGNLIFYEYSRPEIKGMVENFELGGEQQMSSYGSQSLVLKLLPLVDYQGTEIGRILVVKDATELLAQSREVALDRSKFVFLIIALGASLLTLVVYRLLRSSVLQPLKTAVGVANRMAEGDLSVELDTSRQDETGQLLQAMKGMVESTRDATLIAREIAAGNLAVEVRKRSEGDQLMQALGQMVENITGVVEDLHQAGGRVSAGSQALSSSAEEMSQGSTEQAAAAEEASSAIEQMSANIRQNNDNAVETARIASQVAADAESGGEAVLQTTSAMKEITGMISIIEEIARQTNLLALNAAIEAARAGTHGKGFAVVAGEVRKLAERSQTAAGQIAKLSSSSVEVAERAGALLTKIVPEMRKTAELVQEIAAASREQDAGTDQIQQAIMQLDKVTQQNSSNSEELAATAVDLSQQAEHLQAVIGFFRMGGISTPSRTGGGVSSAKPHQPRLPEGDKKRKNEERDILDREFEHF